MQRRPRRHSSQRPLLRISVNLIETYRLINELYYNSRAAVARPTAPEVADDISPSEPSSSSSVAGPSGRLSDDAPVASLPGSTLTAGFPPTPAPAISFQPGTVLNGKYSVTGHLGKGAFGVVVSALHTASSTEVAIKLIKNLPEFAAQARHEWETLKAVQASDPQRRAGIVNVLDSFLWKGYLCIVFERLSMNLYELIQLTNFNGISLEVVQRLAKQLLRSLNHLATLDLIHGDIKPENVLLVHPKKAEIKLIDFSSCIFINKPDQRFPFYIQSRYYRSPEILLHAPYTLGIDVWSLGCLLVELHTGEPVFPGQSEREMVHLICATLGYPPPSMLLRARAAPKYFTYLRATGYSLIPPVSPKITKRPLSTILNVEGGGLRRRFGTPGHSVTSYRLFLDFISKLLVYKSEDRLSPQAALEHPFLNTRLT